MLKVKKTLDNSNTLFSEQFNEHYHSINGAINESIHVFINAGLKAFHKNTIHIFEVGFGTGLNAYLSLLESINNQITIHYTAIELYPLSIDTISGLKYQEQLSNNTDDLFKQMHQSNWNESIKISSSFYLKKIKADFNKFDLDQRYDLIFFDAFSPDIQPDLWSLNNFQKLYNSLNKDGILTTYSSKGIVKQNLRDAGFIVKRLAGPKGKRHMIKAIKEIQ